jgi:hypothetical protein
VTQVREPRGVKPLGSRTWVSVEGFEFGVWGLGFRVWGLGLRVEGSGFRVGVLEFGI